MARAQLFRPPAGFPDRAMLLATIGRWTRFVRFSKALLAFLIMLLLGTVVTLPLLKGDSESLRIAFTGTQEAPDASPMMKNPRFQGTDSQMQPYMVTAESAIQQDADTIVMKKVQADLTTKQNTWLVVKADQGTLSLARQQLYLIGNVSVFHDGGYEMRTQRALVDMAAGTARGDTPLEGQGKIGYISAASFTVLDRGNRLVFDGPVRLVIRKEK